MLDNHNSVDPLVMFTCSFLSCLVYLYHTCSMLSIPYHTTQASHIIIVTAEKQDNLLTAFLPTFDIVEPPTKSYQMTKKEETNNRAEETKTEVIEAKPQVSRKTKIKLRQPTLKQKKLIKTLYKNIENGGTYKQALIEAGYSEKTALQAKNVISSPVIQRLMMSAENIGMSDEWFLEKIRTGLEAQDLNAVSKFANLWARLRYSDAFKQKIDYNDNRTVNVYENLSTEELERLAQLDD